MQIPAIRAQIGDWVYYVSTFSFKQVSDYVKRIDDELHQSQLLRDMLQRSITDNYRSIADYIANQQEHFFNALILAVYDGDPQWRDIRVEIDDTDEYMGIGVLEFNGEEKIFPIDGQHRVEGIKKVVKDSQDYHNERIPVIFVGHRKTADGMQRARRLFSTLNRYAKPVSMRDIIALDEDDVIAIASRELIDNHRLFSNERILDTKSKAIPEMNMKAFTTIITFYECNRELLYLFLKDRVVKNGENRKITGKSKAVEYIKRRPSDEDILAFTSLCNQFWDSLVTHLPMMTEYLSSDVPDTSKCRNRNGGLIQFRPAGLLPLMRAIIRNISAKKTLDDVFEAIPATILHLQNPVWRRVLWEPETNTMVMNNQKVTEFIIQYFINEDLLSSSEKKKMMEKLRVLNQLPDLDIVQEVLDDALLFTATQEG